MSKEVTVDLSHILAPGEVVDFLEMLASMIRAGDYQKVLDNYTFFSPDGDGYGMENTCINFASLYGYSTISNESRDISEVLESLMQREHMKKEAVAKLKSQIELVEKM